MLKYFQLFYLPYHHWVIHEYFFNFEKRASFLGNPVALNSSWADTLLWLIHVNKYYSYSTTFTHTRQVPCESREREREECYVQTTLMNKDLTQRHQINNKKKSSQRKSLKIYYQCIFGTFESKNYYNFYLYTYEFQN